MNLKYKIWQRWNRSKLSALYYNLIYGVQNIVIWFPVIFFDRQWDSYYFYKILYKKILLMEKHHMHYNPFVSKPTTCKKLKTCRLLLKRLCDNEYLDNALRPVKDKYGIFN